jgi:hypothetical protein
MISARERAAIIQSLTQGVTPSVGIRHIQVGRRREVESVLQELSAVKQDASAVRFVVGPYGSGKTFFLQLLRATALEQKFVVLQADITLNRKLHGSGSGRELYRELVANMATPARPEGGALAGCIERWIAEIDQRTRRAGGKPEDVPQAIEDSLRSLKDLTHGFDFAVVLRKYYEGFRDNNAGLQDAALKWLRAEYESKMIARQELGAPSIGIIDDVSYFDALKLLAKFVNLAGYSGLLVNIDELGVLVTKLQNAVARKANYDALLTIVNECSQGRAAGLMFLFAAASDFVDNQTKGLYSHDALASRLRPPQIGNATLRNYASPVIMLEPLTRENRYLLLENVRKVFEQGATRKHALPDEGLQAFFALCEKRLGSAQFETPREAVRRLTHVLQLLEQYPDKNWSAILAEETKAAADPASTNDLNGFKL